MDPNSLHIKIRPLEKAESSWRVPRAQQIIGTLADTLQLNVVFNPRKYSTLLTILINFLIECSFPRCTWPFKPSSDYWKLLPTTVNSSSPDIPKVNQRAYTLEEK